MLKSRLNTRTLTSDLLIRPRLFKKLESKSAVPLILLSAPAGYGKSVLVSQWIKEKEGANAWLSLNDSMNDTATFLSYLGEALNTCSSRKKEVFINLHKEYTFLSWEAIIEIIVNAANELEEKTRLIIDDYHLISNREIHQLVEVLIREEIRNLQIIIISRWDPPFPLRELRLYQKMHEIRMADLKFEKEEAIEFLALNDSISLTNDEIKTVVKRTEGWILAIRMILLARSFPTLGNKKKDIVILTNDLDQLMSYISESLDPDFFRQMQLCALCDQFNAALIDAICGFAFKGSCKGEVFLAKLKALNLFIIPASEDGEWYRFHHLFGEILIRHLKKSEPNSIIPLYNHISAFLSATGLVGEAIHYAIKVKNYPLACEQIIKYKASQLDQGQWWVVQQWLDKIPRQIRNTNFEIMLTELLICEETWNIADFSYILDTLKSIGIENSNDKNISLYLYHLGYFLTFVIPDPKKAVEALERSKALCPNESYMFGGRREPILACSRQMLGLTALALQSLEEIQEKYGPCSIMHIRPIQGKVLVHLLSGNVKSANSNAKKLLFLVRDADLLNAKAWGSYLLGNAAFQSFNGYEVVNAFEEALALEGVFNYRVYFDALAGLTLNSSLQKDEKATASFLEQMSRLAIKLKDRKFQNYHRSVQARVNWHTGQGDKDLSWALAKWAKQHPSSYLFLIDVPELTKLRIVVSHGTDAQIEEAITVLEEVEAILKSVNNGYQLIDIALLKAMGFLRVGKDNLATKWLEEALILAEKKNMIRPVLEANLVMPSLFNLIEDPSPYHILTRTGLDLATRTTPERPASASNGLTLREQELVRLIAKGLRNKEIADLLNISTGTVKSHLTNIYSKLQVPNRTSMLRKIAD